VHELCTNAIKYGALSGEAGHVEIGWRVDDGRIRWSWREQGGPTVAPPQRRGFGTRMIEGALAAQLSGKVVIDFQPAGIVCTIDAPLEAVRDHA
jgi:two-component system CheB/CheR fusion protein